MSYASEGDIILATAASATTIVMAFVFPVGRLAWMLESTMY